MNRLRLADSPQFALADSYLLAASPGGAMMATTDKKCPAGYYYNPSTYNCWPKQSTAQPMNMGFMTLLRDNAENYYVNVPTEDGTIMKVREDAFDYLDPMVWEAVMDILEPYNAPQVSGLFSKWRDNRRQKKEERNERKIAKINARASGRVEVAKAGGGIGGALQKVAGAIFGKDTATEPADTRGLQVDFTTGGTPDPDAEKPWYKKPEYLIPIGIAAAAAVYFVATRKKK